MRLGFGAATFTTLRAYQTLWEDVSERQRGEASVVYLYLPHVAAAIASMNPDVKLIVILRNPVDRAYSHYLMARRKGREPLASFREAIAAEPERLAQDYDPYWHYLSFGFYHEQLERYLKVFDRSQMRIVLNDDLRRDSSAVYAQLLRFLEVDASFRPRAKREYGVGGVPRNGWLYKLVVRPSLARDYLKRLIPRRYHATLLKRLVLTKPELDARYRQFLARAYYDDIVRLEQLLSRDLSAWKPHERSGR
jgi:hypothetical protein